MADAQCFGILRLRLRGKTSDGNLGFYAMMIRVVVDRRLWQDLMILEWYSGPDWLISVVACHMALMVTDPSVRLKPGVI